MCFLYVSLIYYSYVNIIHVKLYYFEQGDAYIFDRSRYVAAYLMRGSMVDRTLLSRSDSVLICYSIMCGSQVAM